MGPREVARALKTKETVMSKRGVGYVAENWSSIENYGAKMIVGYTS